MKAALGGVGAAVAASACCIGPVAMTLIGAGAFGASAIKLEPYRPWFMAITVVLLGVALYGAYRPQPAAGDCADGVCAPQSRRTARVLAWGGAVIAAVVIAFPYYIGWFI